MEEGHDSIARRVAADISSAYDQHMIRFLQKHKIPVDPRNVQATLDKLAEKNYKVVVETEHTGLQATSYKFYLTKIIDQTEFRLTYNFTVDA